MRNKNHPRPITERLRRLLRLLSRARRGVILIHGNPDPDALASAFALQLLARSVAGRIQIRFTGRVHRLENEALMKQVKIPALPLDRNELRRADLVALVDCQPNFLDFRLPRCDVVIDHHPVRTPPSLAFCDIQPQRAATAALLTEYLVARRLPISRRLATALYYGIKSDSNVFRFKLSPADGALVALLDARRDPDLLHRIEFSQYSLATMDYFSIALVKRRYAHGVIYAHLGPLPFSDICVQVADFFMRIQEVHWSLVTGVANQKLTVVFRCDVSRHAGRVAETAFGALGSAGGHHNMGRAEIPEKNLPPGLRLIDNEGIEYFVLKRLAGVDPSFHHPLRILPSLPR